MIDIIVIMGERQMASSHYLFFAMAPSLIQKVDT